MGKYGLYKQQVLECCKWFSEHGYFGALTGTGGNVSIRIEEEPDVLAITPTNALYNELSEDNICIANFEQSLIEGWMSPSVETGMHIGVYTNRADVNAIVHTHQTFASIFSLINQPIPALFDEVAFHIGHTVEIIPYGLSGSQELIENVKSKLDNNCNCYIMQNHGALSLGQNLKEAHLNAELLEKICTIYYHALTTGKEITTLPENIIEAVIEIRKANMGRTCQR